MSFCINIYGGDRPAGGAVVRGVGSGSVGHSRGPPGPCFMGLSNESSDQGSYPSDWTAGDAEATHFWGGEPRSSSDTHSDSDTKTKRTLCEVLLNNLSRDKLNFTLCTPSTNGSTRSESDAEKSFREKKLFRRHILYVKNKMSQIKRYFMTKCLKSSIWPSGTTIVWVEKIKKTTINSLTNPRSMFNNVPCWKKKTENISSKGENNETKCK